MKRKVEASDLFKNEKILVYPNPGTEKIFIDTNNPDSISHLQLFTLNGKSIYKTTKNNIDVRGIESGMHILVISYKDGSQTSRKVMIGK
ncbi:T9SS type A sorting domain-containing protein [Dyadobacter chenwenxiniae]|uniref:T9SS type A sorting domain-containing protein n=1 Tax=Dyadobacter chenwenxiniae TaxID=2906456 RepID=A0A9X1PP53_9BACT|nr:T9SS type A sorting domain-containing protein [Dyadobacter chenwenxiniae]MCF0063965.1 T9SS type A sorting domain-containing protein [Dyadobacter chenwenxiniae]UON82693.1 T9SS type A sorting domain-containing protein [Dyadobacter chenwenxiniae]